MLLLLTGRRSRLKQILTNPGLARLNRMVLLSLGLTPTVPVIRGHSLLNVCMLLSGRMPSAVPTLRLRS